MKHSDALSNAAKTNAVGLVFAAAGIVVQIAAGSDLYPGVPPGPIILLAGAAVVAFGPRRWAPYVGVFVPVFLLVGATISAFVASESFVDQLSDVGEAGIFTGTLMQMIGVVVALGAGIAVWRERRGVA
jgi:hypothetical protein